jgi:hypothetical protein
MGSYAELFEQSRQAVLEALADAIETYHDHKSRLERLDPDRVPSRAPHEGDFLYDFLRLNVQYLNQFARLGSSYSIIGSRVLERLYSYCVPGEKTRPRAGRGAIVRRDGGPVLSGSRGLKIRATIPLKNDSGRSVRCHVACGGSFVRVDGPDEPDEADVMGPADLRVKLAHGPCELDADSVVTLDADEAIDVRVEVTPVVRMTAAARYAGCLELRDAASCEVVGVSAFEVQRTGR